MYSSDRTTASTLSPSRKFLAIIITAVLVASMIGTSTLAQALNNEGEESPETVQENVVTETIVQLDFQNAYIMLDDQELSADQQKQVGPQMTTVAGNELVFSIYTEEGFELNELTAKNAATGAEIPIYAKADDESKLVIEGANVCEGLTLTIKAAEPFVPEAEPEVDEPEAVDGLEGTDEPDASDAEDPESPEAVSPDDESVEASDEQPADAGEADEDTDGTDGGQTDTEASDVEENAEAEPVPDPADAAIDGLKQKLTGSFGALVRGSGLAEGVSLMGDGKEYFTLSLAYDSAGEYGDKSDLSAFWNGKFTSDEKNVLLGQQVKWNYTDYSYSNEIFQPGEVTFKIPRLLGDLEPTFPDFEEQSGLKRIDLDNKEYLVFTNKGAIGPGYSGFFTIAYSFDTDSDRIQTITDPTKRTNPITGEKDVPDMYYLTDTHLTVSFTNEAGQARTEQSNDAPFALTLVKDDYRIVKTVSNAKAIPGDLPKSMNPTAKDLKDFYFIPYTILWDWGSSVELRHSLHTSGITLTDTLPDVEGIELLGASIGMGGGYNYGTALYEFGNYTGTAADYGFNYSKSTRTLTWKLTNTNMKGGATSLCIWVKIPKKSVDKLENKNIKNVTEGNGAYNNDPDNPVIHKDTDLTVNVTDFVYDDSGNNGTDGIAYAIDKTMSRTGEKLTLYAGGVMSQNELAKAPDTFQSTVWVTKSIVSGADMNVDITIVDDFMDTATRQTSNSTTIEQQADSDFYYQSINVIGNPAKIGNKAYAIFVRTAGSSTFGSVAVATGTLATTAGSMGELATWTTSATNIVAAKIVVKDVSAQLFTKELGLYMTGTINQNAKYLADDDAMLINSAYMEVDYNSGNGSALSAATAASYVPGTDTLYASPYNSSETVYRRTWESYAAARDMATFGKYKWRTADRINLVRQIASLHAWKGVQTYGSTWQYNVDEGCFELAYYVQMRVQTDSMRVNNFTMVDILPNYVTIDPDSLSVVFYNRMNGGGSPSGYVPANADRVLPTVNSKAATPDQQGLPSIPLSTADYTYEQNYQDKGSDAILVKFNSDASNENAGLFAGDYVELRFTARCYDYESVFAGGASKTLRNHSAIALNDFAADGTSTTLLTANTSVRTDTAVTTTDVKGNNKQTYTDIDGNGNTNEYVLVNYTDQSMSRNFSAGQNGIVKLITTDKNPIPTKKATSSLGAPFNYIFNINAQGGDLRNLVIYDTLPWVGDTCYKLDKDGNQVPRNSQWAPTLLGIQLGNAGGFFTGSKIYYSTKHDPGLLSEHPENWTAAEDYVATHTNLYDVKSFCIDLGEGELPEGRTVLLTIDVRATADEADIDTLAVNTFHYTSEIKRSGQDKFMDQGVLETNMVNVTVKAGDMILGDTVFFDMDNDGIQGDDEPGIPNALVHLYIVDENGTVTHDGLKLREVDSVYTDENGKYHFVPKEEGTYLVKIDEPKGYDGFSDPVFKEGDNNGDETLQLNKADKDGWLKPIPMDKAGNRRNMHQDAGLIPSDDPPNPPLGHDDGILSVTKTVEDGAGLVPAGKEFTFVISDASGAPLSETPFVLDDGGFGRTGTDGSFTLKAGQVALFLGLPVDDADGNRYSYTVEEIGLDAAAVEGANFSVIHKIDGAAALGAKTDGFGLVSEAMVVVEFVNTYGGNPPLGNDEGVLRVTKTVDDATGLVPADKEFTFVITDATGTPLSEKTFALDGGTTASTGKDGSFTLKNGETALFAGLSAGDWYSVSESAPSRSVSGVDLNIKTVVAIDSAAAASALGTAVEVDDSDMGKLVAFTNSYSAPGTPDNPTTPAKGTPTTPANGANTGAKAPKTGDPLAETLILLGGAAALSGMALLVSSRRRRRSS